MPIARRFRQARLEYAVHPYAVTAARDGQMLRPGALLGLAAFGAELTCADGGIGW